MVRRDTIRAYNVKRPESILDLGLRHGEQISLLEKIQNVVLAEQVVSLIRVDRARSNYSGSVIPQHFH